MTMYGKVMSVETRNLAEPAVADAAVAATTLYVSDASTFDENGGIITVGGETLIYTAIDVEANTLTLAAGLAVAVADQDPITVYPPTPVKTALVDIGEEGGDSVPVTVPHSLLDKLPDGTRDEGNSETVTIVQRGTYELVMADIVGETPVTQTLDYVEGEAGIGIDQSVAQMEDAQVTGQLGAAVVSADSIVLGGLDLRTEIDQASIGKLLSARLPLQGANLAVTSTLTKIFELNCGTVKAGRTYRVATQLLFSCTGTLALTDRLRMVYTHTLDGSTPITTSATMDGGLDDTYGTSGTLVYWKPEGEIDVAAESNLKIALCVQVVSGVGSYSIYAGSSAIARPVMSFYDDGPAGARNDAAITLTGGGTTRFVKTFNPTWAYGIQNSSLVTNPSYFDIGNNAYGSGILGAFGYNSAAIVAALAGATSPVSCVLRWRPRTRLTGTGLDVRFLSHNYASAATFSAAWFPQQWDNISGPNDMTSLATFANAAPNTPYDQSLGTTLFGQFKTGTRKGLAISPSATPSSNSHPDGTGTVYSFGTYQPQLIFTYDGTS